MSAGLAVGDEVDVLVGPVAHGGHLVARHEGRVIFVRHALPGERVRVRLTDGGAGDRFLRGDAVAVLEASPERVAAPCPYAGPGRCGGCDFQHVRVPYQRELKAAVVREQFLRLAGLDLPVVVEPVPGDRDGLEWRTRMDFAVDEHGRAGLRRHRSHEVLPLQDCLIADDRIRGSGVLQRTWPGERAVDVVAAGPGAVVVPVPGGEGAAPMLTEKVVVGGWSGSFQVPARGFWQVHRGAAATFVTAVMDALRPDRGERAVDLYTGVGLFAAALADAVGDTGAVLAVESDHQAAVSAQRNLASRPWAEVRHQRVDRALKALLRRQIRADLVILDPPRTGAGRAVVADLAGLGPRRIAYLACDPAALARDTAYLAKGGSTSRRGVTAYGPFERSTPSR